jgi:hypothetical protein
MGGGNPRELASMPNGFGLSKSQPGTMRGFATDNLYWFSWYVDDHPAG